MRLWQSPGLPKPSSWTGIDRGTLTIDIYCINALGISPPLRTSATARRIISFSLHRSTDRVEFFFFSPLLFPFFLVLFCCLGCLYTLDTTWWLLPRGVFFFTFFFRRFLLSHSSDSSQPLLSYPMTHLPQFLYRLLVFLISLTFATCTRTSVINTFLPVFCESLFELSIIELFHLTSGKRLEKFFIRKNRKIRDSSNGRGQSFIVKPS